MIGKGEKERRPATLAEIAGILEKRLAEVHREEEEKLGLEQRMALEYAKKFAKIGRRKAAEMYEKLMKMEKMKPEVAVKIIDIMPTNEELIKLVFAKERITPTDKDIKEVIKIVEEFKK